MELFSKSKKVDELVLVFDLGSYQVGGALFWAKESGVPKIIFSTTEPIVLLEEMDIDQFFSLTMKSLSVVAGKISRSGHGSPAKIFCVLSSLWYGSQTRTIRLKKNTSFAFNTKLADSLIHQEVDLFKAEHLEKYTHTGSPVLPIELKVMKTVLNGYTTHEPLNQKTQELEMTVFIAMSGEQFLEKVEEVVASNFHRKDIKFSSFVMVSFAVTREMFLEQENFLLVDVGGEVTDIAMVKKSILSESISFPLGRNFMIRGLAKALGSSLEEAKSLLSLYKDGHAEEKTAKTITPIIGVLQAQWLKQFQESLSHLSNDISIPATIFLTVDSDLFEFFSAIIKTEQFNQYTLTESKFRINHLGLPALHSLAVLERGVMGDPFLVMESIYINNFLR